MIQSPTHIIGDDLTVDCGGAGLWSKPRDYAKVLSAVLKNPSPLLKEESKDLMFKGQLGEDSKNALYFTLFGNYPGNEEGLIGNMLHGAALPQGTKVDYSLAGIIATEGVPGGRGPNAVAWGGLPNLVWSLDRDQGKGILYSSQLLPPGDPPTGQAVAKFEQAVYGGKAKI